MNLFLISPRHQSAIADFKNSVHHKLNGSISTANVVFFIFALGLQPLITFKEERSRQQF